LSMNSKHNLEFVCTHIIVLVIFIACLMMAGPMREGLPVSGDVLSRQQYIADNLVLWRLGWFVWMASALGLLLFATFLAGHLEKTVWRTYGLALVALGVAPDLLAEVIYAFVIPYAYSHSGDLNIAAMYEHLAMHLTGFLGNGLYNLGGMTLNILLIRQGLVKPWVAYWGIIAWSLGIGLSVSIALSSMLFAEILTGLSMTLSTFWMFLIAHTLFKNKKA